jgi:hypothetical protein
MFISKSSISAQHPKLSAASAAMKATTMKAPAVKSAAQTRLSARRHSSYRAAMIKATEGARVHTGLVTCSR